MEETSQPPPQEISRRVAESSKASRQQIDAAMQRCRESIQRLAALVRENNTSLEQFVTETAPRRAPNVPIPDSLVGAARKMDKLLSEAENAPALSQNRRLPNIRSAILTQRI